MHYYQFNIGDYASHTRNLSLFEDLAYRRLLDLYYLNERPFNGCSTDVAREIGMVEHQDAVDYVLNKFFKKHGDTWVNNRANDEIGVYQGRIESASKAGKASAAARKNKRSTTVERKSNDRSTNHEPLTSNHKPLTNSNKRFAPPSQEMVLDYMLTRVPTIEISESSRFIDYYSSNGWKVGRNPMKDWKAAVRNWLKNYKPPKDAKTKQTTLQEDLTDRSWAN